jgi:predicted site-specific integrase-resolvase
MDNIKLENYVTLTKAAELLDVSRKTIRTWCNKGLLDRTPEGVCAKSVLAYRERS